LLNIDNGMKRSNICTFVLVATISAIAQIADAQTNSPHPNGNSTNVTVVRPRRPVQRQVGIVQRSNPAPATINYAMALQRYHHVRHTRFWWRQHFATIVLCAGGYYYFEAGYWFPAWGYDPNYEAYDYDGPIYTYGNLLPDQVILNVQRALTELGYYAGPLSGSLSPATRYAISAYQQDNGLVINGIVDGPLVYSLGLI
jgi:Putative peptidoglycan binding domain